MGTADAYDGSAGPDWERARRDADEFVNNPNKDTTTQLLSDIAHAVDWDREGGAAGTPMASPSATLRIRTSGRGRGGRGGGAGGGGGGRSSGGRGGSGRSRAQAARAGGRALAAGRALRAGDRATLEELGLDLDELRTLDPISAVELILDELVPATGSIEAGEMRTASASALVELMESGAPPDGPEVVQLFIVEYVYEISLTELGKKFRDGSRPGADSHSLETQVKDFIQARAEQLDLPNPITPADFEVAINDGLDDIRTLLRTNE